MEILNTLKDVKGNKLYERARSFYAQHEYIKALEVMEDLSFVKLDNINDKATVSFLQGTIFKVLSDETDRIDLKFTYLLASVEIFLPYSALVGLSALAAVSLFDLAEHLDSVSYYKKALVNAKRSVGKMKDRKFHLKHIIETSELKIAESKSGVASSVKRREECVASVVKKSEERVSETKENEETRKSDSDLVKGLRSYWAGLNDEAKRNFMKVSVKEFRSFVEEVYGREGRDALEEVLASAKEDRKWMFWMCRTCSKKFTSADECKKHLEQEHGAKVQLKLIDDEAQIISENWAHKVLVGGWEPLDAVAAVDMIKSRFEDVKAFGYENGWSKDWPLAVDQERSKLLREIQQLLVAFYDRRVLSDSILGCVMDSAIDYLAQLEVPDEILTEGFLTETPQSICFLECDELNEILDFLRSIECERNDGFDLVCRAVESFCDGTRVKEKIDFDPKFSFLLLDKRLLQGKIAQYDDEGTINVFGNLNAHYAKAQAHGDDILSWLGDNTSRDETFRFPRPIRVHNLDIWVAVLKVIRYMCRTLGAKYDKKLKFLSFVATLDDTKKLCMLEDERRRNIRKDQWTLYATCICGKYEKLLHRSSLDTRIRLSAVRQVLEGTFDSKFDFPDSEDSLNVIREHKSVTDDSVLDSIEHLLSIATDKICYEVPRIDLKILLIENSRINLLNQLTRLSVFDYRSYILGPLKEFLLKGILDMESKAKIAVANAARLLEEEEENKPQLKKKKTKKMKQNPLTSLSSPLGTIIEHEPEHPVPSKTGQLETSSNTDHQEEAVTSASQLTNMAGESLQSEQLESTHGAAATRCKYALEMTLKALCNIQVLKEYLVLNRDQFADNVVEQVPLAIQNFFSAFASEAIKGVYSCLLDDLLAFLESKDAAQLLVSILEFWPCWKNPEIECVVTHLFTLEEYERVSCTKCRKDQNYSEQSSYGIVMAADSIRYLKCAFEDMKFDDILKLKRMEDKMICKCGKANYVHRIIGSRYPFIFTIVLEWVKNETEEEISETTKALDCEIDISRLYEGLEPNTKFRLSSMVCYGEEEEEYICLAYKTNQWFSLRHEALSEEEVVGDWECVVRFCEERKIRPEILFYEDASPMA